MQKEELVMKNKFLVGLLALVMCFVLVGCGKSDNENTDTKKSNSGSGEVQGSDKKGDGLDNVTESNYAKLLKENYGIDAIYGEGWTIKEVSSPNKVNNLRINYKTPKDIDKDEWTKKYFDATLAISTDSINPVKMNFDTGALSKGDKISTYEEYKNSDGMGWYYYWNGRQIQCNPSIYAGDALITFTFTETN